MIHSTATVPVNPDGEPRLAGAQLWRTLELKARDTRLFLPPAFARDGTSARKAPPISCARRRLPGRICGRSSRSDPKAS